MTHVFYFLASLLILQGLISVMEGVRFWTFVRCSVLRPPNYFFPRVAILAPCKGVDPNLEDNLEALFRLDYPDYEIVFAVASSTDPALGLINRLIEKYPRHNARLVVAGISPFRSEKVNNLLRALEAVSRDRETLVFVDSDTTVRKNWLKNLVAGLADPSVGATTGYRWYLPVRGGVLSAVLSAWNGSVATTLGDHGRNFAWGGSTAIMKSTFDRIGVAEGWQKALSDDYVLTSAVRRAGLRIQFVPNCLTISRDDPTLDSLLEFTTRQITITRVFRPAVWWVGLLSHAFFTVVFFGGLALITMGAFGAETWIAAFFLLIIYVLGSVKGFLRLRAAGKALTNHAKEVMGLWWMYCILWPSVSVLFLYNFLRSACTQCITWRDVTYIMKSPAETVVVARRDNESRGQH